MHCQCTGVPSIYLLQLLHDLLEGGLQLLGHSPLHCCQLAQRVVFLHIHTLLVCNLDTKGHMLRCMHRSAQTVCWFVTWSQHATCNMQRCMQPLNEFLTAWSQFAAFAAFPLTEKPHD